MSDRGLLHMSTEFGTASPILLIAPNISERMGGEAIKSLQILKLLSDRGLEVRQITHSRVRAEISTRYPELKVDYIEENRIDYWLWKTKIFGYLITPLFMFRAARLASKLVKANPGLLVHYTSPISPVVPLFQIPGVKVVVGPLNGNIHHPPGFRHRESLFEKVRRLTVVPSQWFHRLFFNGKQTADVLLVAGGERTYQSLKLAGCRDEQFRDTLDSGIDDSLLEEPVIEHVGTNVRFVHQGRLVAYKGTDLAIQAIARTRNPIILDVIGDGEERRSLEKLVQRLGLADRVRFKGWMKHEELIPALRSYRAMVAPSLAEANGIVFQEAMMIGLPIIGVDWGGPTLLVTPETGFLIPPRSEEQIINDVAERMDRLAEDAALAQQMGHRSRAIAIERGFSWSDLISRWITIYREVYAFKAETRLPDPCPPGLADGSG